MIDSKNNRRIILTGFMGTGKSAVGAELARLLGYDFVDTDHLIEKRTGRSIVEIFAESGEQVFRELENQIAGELVSMRDVVIATGGGFMINQKNADLLGTGGTVFCLTADPEVIINRLENQSNSRPLLGGADPAASIRQLLAEREPIYARFTQVSTDGRSISEVAKEILVLMQVNKIIRVSYPQGQYSVLVGLDLLSSLRDISAKQGMYALITDSNVGPLYAEQCGADVVVTIPAGEQYKTLATVSSIYDQLLSAGMDRQGTIVALGGGVVGDVAGYVASTFMRGVDFIQVPTSLLAMVDASVGGKTGVDLPQGKNLVGAFKQPLAVFADLRTLLTLPQTEFSAGLAEVVKSGIIGDPALFQLIEHQAGSLKVAAGAPDKLLADIVSAAIEVKRQVVEADPFEKGRRAVLNLGHTFGHAIEQVSGYQIRHGEAIAMGLVAAAHLSAMRAFCDPDLESRIEAVLSRVLLPTTIPTEYKAIDIFKAMDSDKKKVSGQLRFVLPRELGDVFVTDEITQDLVLATLHHCGAG